MMRSMRVHQRPAAARGTVALSMAMLACLAALLGSAAFAAPSATAAPRGTAAAQQQAPISLLGPQAPLRGSHVRMATTALEPREDEDKTGTMKQEPLDGEASGFFSRRTLKLVTLFGLWYVLNIGYNIGNKLVLTALPIPWTSATIELFFGLPYVGMLWLTGLRKRPKLSLDNIKLLIPSAFFLAATHVGGVISFGAGAISFTHVLKATEPVWAALISAVFFREFLSWPVYASLVPIIAGVGLASLTELSFTWLSFFAALLSAVTSASKAILSKKVLDGKPLGENLTAGNMFAVLTILGCAMILPASLMMEGPAKVSVAWAAAREAGYSAPRLWTMLGVSGFLYYIYNEVAFLALKEVAPLTHAITNTVKRVVIILASVAVFHNPITFQGALGSGVAILGACMYSIAKGKYAKK